MMKLRNRYISVLCASLAIASAFPAAGLTALAAQGDPSVIYDGAAREFRLENTTGTDLFADFKQMMPGDEVTQEINVAVEHTDGPVTVYLTPGPAAAEKPEIFKNVTLTVRADGRVVSETTLDQLTQIPGGSEGENQGIELYTFEKPGEKTLEATLKVEEEAGNELMDAQASVNWKFTVQDYSSGNTVRIRAMDLTAYTGGDSMSNDSFPKARYYIEAPRGVELDEITFYIDGTDAFTVPEEAEDGEIIQELEETFTYLSGDGAQAPSENDEAPGLYEIGIEEEGRLTAKVGGDEYSVVYEPGTLTVRYVTDPEGVLEGSEDIATPVTVDAAQAARTGENESGSAADVPADKAFGVVSADTTFRTNGKTDIAGLTEDDGTGQIALMCDDILSLGTDIENRVEQMTGRAEEFLTARGNSLEQRQYEYKYLDLINEHDGNAWVSSSEGVDVYYPYPEGTSYETAGDTVFTILHFKDLHREYGFESGETIEQLINDCEVEAVPVEATEQGLKFHVPESGFSPFAVTWQPKDLHTGPVDDGSGDDGSGGDGSGDNGLGGGSGAGDDGADAEEAVAETGDQTNIFTWTAAALLALAVLGAGGYFRWSYKRRDR